MLLNNIYQPKWQHWQYQLQLNSAQNGFRVRRLPSKFSEFSDVMEDTPSRSHHRRVIEVQDRTFVTICIGLYTTNVTI
jgi:hypothetical protein